MMLNDAVSSLNNTASKSKITNKEMGMNVEGRD
jgi:hypothetical protein